MLKNEKKMRQKGKKLEEKREFVERKKENYWIEIYDQMSLF